jgi:lipopolysaccharide/colanic/teichoic acid biosynthesis glycosyltransferase
MPDAIQRMLALCALVIASPLIALLAILVRLDSPGPALYRAVRVGVGGRQFRCLKLRTMRWAPGEAGVGAITARDDDRVTRLGRVLRRLRLDELPQLINVVRGEMNLVGPRPEDPRFVDIADPLHRLVFTAKPGITGLAQLEFVDESDRLGHDPAAVERVYRETVLPAKLAVDARYLRERSWRLDAWILARTAAAVLGRRRPADEAGGGEGSR